MSSKVVGSKVVGSKVVGSKRFIPISANKKKFGKIKKINHTICPIADLTTTVVVPVPSSATSNVPVPIVVSIKV